MNPEDFRLTDEERRIAELVREAFREAGVDPDAPFRPVAFWHKELNTIVVVVRDCSACHVRVNDGLTLMEDQYPEDDEDRYVGFEVHATPGFYENEGLLSGGSVELNQALDMLVRKFPGDLLQIEICRTLLGRLETTTVELA